MKRSILAADPWKLNNPTRETIESACQKLTVVQLRQRLTDLDVEDVKGLKAALVERLVDVLMQEDTEMSVGMSDVDAAVLIQKIVRGHLVRRTLPKSHQKAKTVSHGKVSHKVNREKAGAKLTTEDAAITIQMAVRKHLAKKTIKRKRTTEDEPSTKRQRAQTCTLHITKFVRPLTLPQVKTYLGQFGEIKEFWMDVIKSNCFVTYDSPEEAQKCMDRVDGDKWPEARVDGGVLKAVFVTEEHAKVEIAEKENPQPKPKAASPPATMIDTRRGISGQAVVASPFPTTDSKPHIPVKRPIVINPRYTKTDVDPPIYYRILTDEEVAEKKATGWRPKYDIEPKFDRNTGNSGR
jgi:hypothetical protein